MTYSHLSCQTIWTVMLNKQWITIRLLNGVDSSPIYFYWLNNSSHILQNTPLFVSFLKQNKNRICRTLVTQTEHLHHSHVPDVFQPMQRQDLFGRFQNRRDRVLTETNLYLHAAFKMKWKAGNSHDSFTELVEVLPMIELSGSVSTHQLHRFIILKIKIKYIQLIKCLGGKISFLKPAWSLKSVYKYLCTCASSITNKHNIKKYFFFSIAY